jgi:IclR family transcriptional regulator, acetate operon repressor
MVRPMSGTERAKYPVKSLAKALRLLEFLGKPQEGTSIAVLSKELKIGKSTVHRLLATLREFDLVWLDPTTSNYALGARILRWSDLLVRQNLLIRHGLPILRELMNTSRETANLAVLEGNEVLYVAQCESNERLRTSEAVGTRAPAHSTSLGKVLFAMLPEEQFDEVYKNTENLERVTPNTITERSRLKVHLQKVRQEGVAYDFEENVIGVVCIGTVVRDFAGQPVAGLSISVPTQRVRGDNLSALKEQLLSAAHKLSAELGYEAPTKRSTRNELSSPVEILH